MFAAIKSPKFFFVIPVESKSNVIVFGKQSSARNVRYFNSQNDALDFINKKWK